jgi:hypothetical protein
MVSVVTVPLQGLSSGEQLLVGVGGIALGVYILMNTGGVVGLFKNMATSEVTPAAEVPNETGIIEVTGTAKPIDGTVQSTHTDTECLLYDYNKTRRVDRDPDHDMQDEHHDVQHLDHQHDHVPFYVEDESGAVAVDPDGANFKIESDEIDGHQETGNKRIRFEEDRIDIGETVHVWGPRKADEDSPTGEVYIGDKPDANFRIGTGGRTRAVAQAGTQAVLTLLVGLVCLLGGAYFLLALAGVV